MNSYWQVLRTYLWRPRFWVLGLVYLLVVWFWFWFIAWNEQLDAHKLRDNALAQSIASAAFTSLTGCFLALHVRRQFTTAAAQAIPGFATPHLVVAGLVAALMWLIAPLTAVSAGHWPSGALALHGMAAILMVIVACWPRGIMLLVAIPVLLLWAGRPMPRGQTHVLVSLANGGRPGLMAILFALAIIGQIVAAWFLLRAPRQGNISNDELTLESPGAYQDSNSVSRWLLTARDAAAQRLMAARVFRSIQRWRVPVATSPLQYLSPFVVVLVACGIGWILGHAAEWAIVVIAITSAVLLLVPLAPWHARRKTMSQELLLPVTRERYFRDIFLAMASDAATWTAISSLLIAAPVVLAMLKEIDSVGDWRNWLPLLSVLSVVWCMATFVFGVGLATIRWPFWLPMVATITLLWFFGGMYLSVLIGQQLHNWTQWRDVEIWVFPAFFIFTVLCGLVLMRRAYRRWVCADVG